MFPPLAIPWAGRREDFAAHHLKLLLDGQPRYWLWQAASTDGDLIRFSRNGGWRYPGEPVQGVSGVNGKRILVVTEDGIHLMNPEPFGQEIPNVDQLGLAKHRLCAVQPADPHPGGLPSVPKRSAGAVSVAGPPSDAFDLKQPGARFLYRDSGKRYDYRLDANGVVVATHPDGRTTALTQAISYTRTRKGDLYTAPPFDLIAAGGARVFAKARGLDQFYFATLDELFIRVARTARSWRSPSTYFKLDPEFSQPGAWDGDLTAHMRGCFGTHPAVERFPQVFWPVLEHNLLDMMIVRVRRRVWHQLDVRPPLNRMDANTLVFELLRDGRGWRSGHRFSGRSRQPTMPGRRRPRRRADLPARQPLRGRPHRHADHHALVDQVRAGARHRGRARPLARAVPARHRRRIAAHARRGGDELRGPAGDLARAVPDRQWPDPRRRRIHRRHVLLLPLVQLKPDNEVPVNNSGGVVGLQPNAFALLYADEQFYFTQRWRLVHPDDFRASARRW